MYARANVIDVPLNLRHTLPQWSVRGATRTRPAPQRTRTAPHKACLTKTSPPPQLRPVTSCFFSTPVRLSTLRAPTATLCMPGCPPRHVCVAIKACVRAVTRLVRFTPTAAVSQVFTYLHAVTLFGDASAHEETQTILRWPDPPLCGCGCPSVPHSGKKLEAELTLPTSPLPTSPPLCV